MPRFPGEFEIPDEWVEQAGLVGFNPKCEAYISDPRAVLITLAEIQPPFRNIEFPKDFRGFDKDRIVRAMRMIANGLEIEPISLLRL